MAVDARGSFRGDNGGSTTVMSGWEATERGGEIGDGFIGTSGHGAVAGRAHTRLDDGDEDDEQARLVSEGIEGKWAGLQPEKMTRAGKGGPARRINGGVTGLPLKRPDKRHV